MSIHFYVKNINNYIFFFSRLPSRFNTFSEQRHFVSCSHNLRWARAILFFLRYRAIFGPLTRFRWFYEPHAPPLSLKARNWFLMKGRRLLQTCTSILTALYLRTSAKRAQVPTSAQNPKIPKSVYLSWSVPEMIVRVGLPAPNLATSVLPSSSITCTVHTREF